MKRWQGNTEAIQSRLLERLLKRAAHTLIGTRYGFSEIKSYTDFAKKLPVTRYEDIRPLVMRMVAGESDILWPGRVTNYAQSSGTSDGRSKFIPITREGLSSNHIAGAACAVAAYLDSNPRSRMFSGRGFILGGSFSPTIDTTVAPGTRIGDLSATLISRVPRIVNDFYRVPSRKISLMSDWEQKLPALIKASSVQNVTNISGVPSWFLAVLKGVLDYTGKPSIKDVWPHIEVFFHGGICFDPYRDLYRKVIGDTDMHYVETYNASEGFFAVQDDPALHHMLLLLDTGVFYEFLEQGESIPVPAWEVEQGKIYELLITSCNGLWRYSPGDTVRIESTDPLRITIAGRTKHFINAFGEEVMVYNADAAITAACRKTGVHVINYTAAPVYTSDQSRGRHQWLIEFDRQPGSIQEFADELDRTLRAVNSDYDAKRSHDLFLDRAEVIPAPAGIFDRWLASTGRLGGQRKVPRLSNDRTTIDALLSLITK
ncbi:MAG: GH3 auxin-responsive promoter family protein [Muribaculaceae bacterium]|nr:GH3 auxin-responsive promoter family protein [Muribaculaceae bacterium]